MTINHLLWLLVFLAALPPPAASETIQLENEQGAYVIRVRINGQISLPFILDTGASEVAMPEDVFLTLLRTKTVNESDYIGTGTYITADGSEHSSDRFILHEMRIGNHAIKNVIANIVPAKGNPLLGQSFLAKLPGWSIDVARTANPILKITI